MSLHRFVEGEPSWRGWRCPTRQSLDDWAVHAWSDWVRRLVVVVAHVVDRGAEVDDLARGVGEPMFCSTPMTSCIWVMRPSMSASWRAVIVHAPQYHLKFLSQKLKPS